MTKSESINELAAALSLAQADIVGAIKDSKNPFFKSSYADLASVWDAIRLPLTSNGLSITQLLDESEHGTVIETMLLHKSGQFISGRCKIVSLKQDPQSIGSAVTYFRRYALSAILSVPALDDDANAATNHPIDKHFEPQQESPVYADSFVQLASEPSKTPQEAIEKLKKQVTKSTYNPNNKTATNHVEHKHRWGEYKYDSLKEQCKNKLPDGSWCNLIRHKDSEGPPPFDDNDPLPF